MSPIPDNANAKQIKDLLNKEFKLLTTIVVDTGNTLFDPDPLQCLRSGPVVWLVYNNDTTEHTVGIDPNSFKNESTGLYENPLAEKKPLTVTVQPKSVGLMDAHIKGDAKFNAYKYTITTLGGTPLDPELDVVVP